MHQWVQLHVMVTPFKLGLAGCAVLCYVCLQVWQYSQAKAKNPVPTWLLAYGGIGICLGLATCRCYLNQ